MAKAGEKQATAGAPPVSAIRRWLPVAVILVVVALAYATGLHKHLALETLVRHRAAIGTFIDANFLAAVVSYVCIYVIAVTLSLPGALFLTLAGGVLFGVIVGGIAAVIGATIGATCIFLIAKTAFGEHLMRKAGPLAARLADGFRADAFNYLLFLRLVPAFPFWLVNLAPALFGVPVTTFVIATALGVIPGTFAFSFFGAGLNSVISAQGETYNTCVAAGRSDCQADFDVKAVLTPELLAAFVALGIVALVPVAVKHWRSRRQAAD